MAKELWKQKPRNEMTDDQRAVLTVNEGGVAGYGLTEHSKSKRPEYYGIKRTAKVNRLLGAASPKRRPDHYKLSVFVPLSLIGGSAERFREVLRFCGYNSITSWVWTCVGRLFAEYAAKSKTKNRSDGGSPKAVVVKIPTTE